MPKLVEPPGECKSDYRICAEIAERLGIGEAYTEGRDERAWVEWCLDHFRGHAFPSCPRWTNSSDRTWAYTPARSRSRPSPLPISAPTRSAPAAHALRQDRDLLQAAVRHGRPGRDPGRAEVYPGVGKPIRAGGRKISAAGHRASHAAPGALDARQQRLAGGSLPAARLHQPDRRGRRAASRMATWSGSSTTAARRSCPAG